MRPASCPAVAGRPGFDLPAACAVAEELRQLRIARGEKPVGYKIGFTNRGIWQRYGVHAPIWGPVWDSTVQMADGGEARVSLAALSQPRLEPEIVFGFVRTPRAGMSLGELQDCLAWVAHGFEIVHTHFDGWRCRRRHDGRFCAARPADRRAASIGARLARAGRRPGGVAPGPAW